MRTICFINYKFEFLEKSLDDEDRKSFERLDMFIRGLHVQLNWIKLCFS